MGNQILKFKQSRKNQIGQSILEALITFVVMISLLLGITKIWLWANTQIVRRQINYNNTRVIAGQSHEGYIFPVWPVYAPPALSEDDVILR